MSKRYTPEKPKKTFTHSPLKTIKPRTTGQQDYLKAIEKHTITLCEGPPGTGKTLLAVYCAAQALLEESVEKIVLAKPVIEAGEQYGFLPGQLIEKLDPVMKPLYDCLEQCISRELLTKWLQGGVIEVCPLGLMRGRTFANCFIVIDESQNATYSQLKLAFTRIGENSKLIATSDSHQIDLPRREDSGIIPITKRLENTEGVACLTLTNSDIQRSEIVKKILEVL